MEEPTSRAGANVGAGWPRMRLRIGNTLVLLSLFDFFVTRRMSTEVVGLTLVAGLALLVWAGVSIREWQKDARLARLPARTKEV